MAQSLQMGKAAVRSQEVICFIQRPDEAGKSAGAHNYTGIHSLSPLFFSILTHSGTKQK
jgi:hypothetical protein